MNQLMRLSAHTRAHRGAALVIGLLLMLIITILATAGITMSTGELAMAGNEQFRRQAAEAASSGIEVALAALARSGSGSSQPTTEATRAGAVAGARYITTTRYAGEEAALPNFSAERFAARHFEIESRGEAGRNALDEQHQGVMIVRPVADGERTFTRRAAGLGDVPVP